MVRRKRQFKEWKSRGGRSAQAEGPLCANRQTEALSLKALVDTPPWDWPADAGKMFREILTDSTASASDRLIAARLAGDFSVINDALSETLMGIVSSAGQPEELRAASAISLGPVLEHADTSGFEDPDDVPITEHTFDRIQLTLHNLYLDDSVPGEVRRRILEASVRSLQDWHRDAISRAYSSGDRDWMLTAVFSMRWVRGFDDLILDALKSHDPEIHCEAVLAAGNWKLDGAWSHIAALARDSATPKPLRLAAIGAVADIRPLEANEILFDLTASDDPEIAEAADEAIALAIGRDSADDDDEDEDEWINCPGSDLCRDEAAGEAAWVTAITAGAMLWKRPPMTLTIDLPEQKAAALAAQAKAMNISTESYLARIVERALDRQQIRAADALIEHLDYMASKIVPGTAPEELESALDEALEHVRPRRAWRS